MLSYLVTYYLYKSFKNTLHLKYGGIRNRSFSNNKALEQKIEK